MPFRADGESYLSLAERAILLAEKPLTPREMLAIARENGFMPSHLGGKTPHRTLAARLAEYIRAKGHTSRFFRTAPATFFLDNLASRPGTPDSHRKVYIGHRRAKAVKRERVLVADRLELQQHVYGSYVRYDEQGFENIYRNICHFLDRQMAESDRSVKQFVTFTLVLHRRKLLIYRRGKFTTASERLQGQLSFGFGGHVNDEDFDRFRSGGDAFKANAARELREELFLDEVYKSDSEAMGRSDVLGYINVDDSQDAEQHIAVLMRFDHRSSELPKKGELSINQLEWIDLDIPRNDLTDFDLWSGMILRSIYEGRIDVS